jgi:hypothetical protein
VRHKSLIGLYAFPVKLLALWIHGLVALQHVHITCQSGLLFIQHEVAVPKAANGISRYVSQVVKCAKGDFGIRCIIRAAGTFSLLVHAVIHAIIGGDLAMGDGGHHTDSGSLTLSENVNPFWFPRTTIIVDDVAVLPAVLLQTV